MAFEPVRIIHASHLRLDHQLEGLTHLPHDLHRVVEDATLSAFDFLLAACIDHQVDFLLLTGNTFDWHDGSLRAWSALEQGFELLGEHGVHVFVVPGETDPASAWLNGPHWPDNVTILYAEDGEPVAAMRDDKAVATVRLLDAKGKERDGLKLPRTASGSGPLRLAPFTIGVMPIDSTHLQDRLATQEKTSARLNEHETVAETSDIADEFGDGIIDDYADDDEALAAADDQSLLPPHLREFDVIDYIALGGPPRRQTFVTDDGLAHHPGTTQGMHAAECGHCGVTLVELDRQGKGRSTFIPTGVVRWERSELKISADGSIDELKNAVRERVQSIAATSTEKVCIVRWSAPGNGRLERELGGHDRLRETIERAAAEVSRASWRMVHHVEWTCTDRIHASEHTSSQLRQEYLDGIAEIAAGATEQSAAAIKRLERQLGNDLAKKILFQQKLDTARIHQQARRLGHTWFHEMRGENDAA